MVLNEDGQIAEKEFIVEGRKRPLLEIRKKLLKQSEIFTRERSDEEYAAMSALHIGERLKAIGEYHENESEDTMRQRLKKIERTRYFKIWHDLSTIANHSHLVFMASCLYDPAVYYTNKEFAEKHHKQLDVQAKVEAPQVHIIARSSSTDYEQLAYTDTRIECLCELTDHVKTENGHEVTDVMRFFHGDSPSRQYESGQQKGGIYYCPVCEANAHRVYELDYALSCKYMSLEERQQLVLKGPIGRKKSLEKNNKPLSKLTKDEITRELAARGIYEGKTKTELEKLLVEELHGVQRVPALLYNMPNQTMESINCQHYEILPFEPLHDIGKHIENVFDELPHHLTKEEAKAMLDVIEVSLTGKETKRTFDYRCSLIQVAQHTRGKIPCKAQKLLDTLVEIQAIAYSSDESRTPRQVLRFHNLTWYHGTLCREVIGFTLKKLTCRKFYGNYFHNITSHAAFQNRMISGRSSNVEEQERVFNTLKNICRTTSSNHPNQLIGNIMVRMQAEAQLKGYQAVVSNQQKQVSKLASALPAFGNSSFPTSFLIKHSSSWQAHLEKVSDFLLPGKGVWWNESNEGCMEFFDAKGNPENQPSGPELHHFRSTSFQAEEKYLNNCWKSCLDKQVNLPLCVLRIPDENGNMVIVNDCAVQDNEDMTTSDATSDVHPDDTAESSNDGTEIVVSFSIVGNDELLQDDQPINHTGK